MTLHQLVTTDDHTLVTLGLTPLFLLLPLLPPPSVTSSSLSSNSQRLSPPPPPLLCPLAAAAGEAESSGRAAMEPFISEEVSRLFLFLLLALFRDLGERRK